MRFTSIYPIHPRTNPWNFRKNILRIGGAEKWHFLAFWLLGFSKKNCFVFCNANQLGFYMRYHLLLHYGWFVQNLGKDFIRTNMHTTVASSFLGSVIIKYVQVRRATTILERREGALSWCACWTPGSILSIQGRRRSFILFNRSCIMIMTQGTSWNEF